MQCLPLWTLRLYVFFIHPSLLIEMDNGVELIIF